MVLNKEHLTIKGLTTIRTICKEINISHHETQSIGSANPK